MDKASVRQYLPYKVYLKTYDYGTQIHSIVIKLPTVWNAIDLESKISKITIINTLQGGVNHQLQVRGFYLNNDFNSKKTELNGECLHLEILNGTHVIATNVLHFDDVSFHNKYSKPDLTISYDNTCESDKKYTTFFICEAVINHESDKFKKLSYKNKLLFRYFVPKANSGLVIWLHGAGEGGDDNESHILANRGALCFQEEKIQKIFNGLSVIAPQCPSFWCPSFTLKDGRTVKGDRDYTSLLDQLIREFTSTYEIDTKRIYIVGASMGGYQVWKLLVNSPNFYAAAIINCPAYLPDKTEIRTSSSTPIWLVHSMYDDITPVDNSRVSYKELESISNKHHYTEVGEVIINQAYYMPHSSYYFMLRNELKNKHGDSILLWLSQQYNNEG